MNLGWQRHICVGLKVRGLDEIKNWFLEYLDIKREQMRRDQQRRMRSINVSRSDTRRRQWHPTPVLLPGKSMDRGAW